MGFADVISTIQSPFSDEPETSIPPNDFEYLKIEELPEVGEGLMCVLANHMLPVIPFTFGGDQRVIKEYYAGNDYPTTQILGATEDDIVMKGKLRDRRFEAKHKDKEFSKTIANLLTDIRRRGYLCKMSLGEYVWHGFLSQTKFDMKTLRSYEYELTFTVTALGELPSNQCPIIGGTYAEMSLANQQLADEAAALAAKQSSIPESVPLSIGEALNKAIGAVAGVVAGVTSFVDAVLSNVEGIQNAVTRATGLVTNAKTQAFKYATTLGQISYATQLAGVKVDSQYKIGTYVPPSTYQGYQAVAQLEAMKFIADTISTMNDTMKRLKQLEDSFKELKKTVPKARYLVKADETLQQVSTKFYGTVDNWSDIKKHNKLESTVLEAGQVLEIPNID